eukprot:1112343-Amphidinium_carterae.1
MFTLVGPGGLARTIKTTYDAMILEKIVQPKTIRWHNIPKLLLLISCSLFVRMKADACTISRGEVEKPFYREERTLATSEWSHGR